MNVVYCVTANYIDKIKPSIMSLREHNRCRIYLVTEADSCDIEGVKVIDIRNQQWFKPETCVNYYNMFTYIGFLKVCYPELLPCDKVIHLDADTIVTDSLKEMWNTDLNGKWFAMVQEYKGRYKPFGEKYYNAGVMLINLKQLRKDKVQDEMVEYLNTVKQPWCEQDAFDKLGMERNMIVDLDVRYNENQFTGYTDSPAIVHYAGVGDWWTNHNISRGDLLKKYKDLTR